MFHLIFVESKCQILVQVSYSAKFTFQFRLLSKKASLNKTGISWSEIVRSGSQTNINMIEQIFLIREIRFTVSLVDLLEIYCLCRGTLLGISVFARSKSAIMGCGNLKLMCFY